MPGMRTMSLDQEIAVLAKVQHGLVTTAQLRALGLSRSGISRRGGRGVLHPVHRGVWSVGHAALSQRARWHAAVLAVGDGAALSHLPAAVCWQLWNRSAPGGIDVVAPGRHRPVPGVRVHQSRGLLPRDVRRRDGVPVTSVARTILDLGDVLTPFQLANVLHEATFRKRLDRRGLERLLTRCRGRRAVTVVRRALALSDGGCAGTGSDLEDRCLAALHARGLEPLVNVPIDVGDGQLRPDFHWPALRAIVEVDGHGHARRRTRAEDLGRDARFRAAGWRVLRCGPHGVADMVEQIASLAARGATGP